MFSKDLELTARLIEKLLAAIPQEAIDSDMMLMLTVRSAKHRIARLRLMAEAGRQEIELPD